MKDKSGMAEVQRLEAESELARTPLTSLPEFSHSSPDEMLHELRVHQIELEMQNEELRRAQISLEESRDRYLDLYDFAPVGYFTLTSEGQITEVNLTGASLFGIERSKLLQRRFARFVTIEDKDRWHRYFIGVLRNKEQRQCELTVQRPDGSAIEVQLDSLRIDIAGGDERTRVVRVTVTDIHIRKQAEVKLHLIAKVFEQSGEAIMVTDADRTTIMVNQAFTTISGYSEAETIGQNQTMLQTDHHGADFYQKVWATVDLEGHWQGEMSCRRRDGHEYMGWFLISRVLNADSNPSNYIMIFSDITEHKEAQAHIQRLAHFDPLTGLPNRSLLKNRILHDLAIAQRNQSALTLMFLDLDHFKNVNDSLGHQVGDQLLIAWAKRLINAVRGQDTISRLGGDEFILVFPETDAIGAAHLVEKLLELSQQPYQIEQYELVVTPSIGIAVFPGDGTDFETLCRCADVAMYRAKQAGRNGFRFFTSEMQASSARVMIVENALRHALERDQFQLYFQPQVRLSDSQLVGAEVLLRWEHPELGHVDPADFIPIAEDSGQILQIGEWVLRQAVRQCKAWIDKGLAPILIAVNLSAVQFRDPRFPELVMQVLREEQLPPQYLELELTEGVAMDNPLEAIIIINRLLAHGISMSIDDFGTGYSSLSYLRRFDINKLKIDQSFVCEIGASSENRAIINAILGVAKSLGLKTIAEGVESEEQMTFLREKGCDEVQGFFIGKPLPAEQFEENFERQVLSLNTRLK
ncbi:putative bifunctional diguanylate cyclase/phosphodiesterase [Glaciimonas immobilis]|uniref:Diguanylate cyclase (GGDEF)-like protein/PAS domain S-box-containing protein n=1 Tax=Glaciimonas immobilis TaxID=728004 RepID=A0A840RW05_9BURK|nr:bifunctional diguanylate cyclase/phosphodiesterase [Glaciimonas immobilis]KAF3997472.1 EAL domain-containing protein [Glaciimonas immobilis]MBB5200854.1 diguanylate cyclase (GGDEF)-like protein/PAS domain S-box-containing protein [Glaciimonas immobilis]